MMMTKLIILIIGVFFSAVSLANAQGYSFCACYVNGQLVYGNSIRSPDGSFSFCTCPPPTQNPSYQNPVPSPPNPMFQNPPPHLPSPSPQVQNPPPAPSQPVQNPPPSPSLDLESLKFKCFEEFNSVLQCYPQLVTGVLDDNCCKSYRSVDRDCADAHLQNDPNIHYTIDNLCSNKGL